MLSVHAGEHLERLQHLVAGSRRGEVKGAQHERCERPDVRVALGQLAEKGLSLAGGEGRGLLDSRADPLPGNSAEDLTPHRLGRDGGVEEDLGDGAQHPDTLRLSLRLVEAVLDQRLLAAGEGAADQDVEHLHEGVRDLLAADDEEGQQQGAPLRRRVAAQRLRGLLAHHGRPLSATVGGDRAPVERRRQRGSDPLQPLAVVDHGPA
jgi:hypothetical protein